MNITFYNNVSETTAIDKIINEIYSISGALNDESSLLDPIIIFRGIDEYIGVINYAYIEEFGRYYFITNIDSVRNNLWRLSFHVDVLYTYREQIKGNYAVIERNEIQYDLKLNDGIFKTQQNPRIVQKSFPSGFNQWNFVLAVAGN